MGLLHLEGLRSARTLTTHPDWVAKGGEANGETSASELDKSKPESDVGASDLEGKSDPGSGGSSEKDDLPEEVMKPKWGRDRLSESVLPATTKPMKEPTTRRSCTVPSVSESETLSPTCGQAS